MEYPPRNFYFKHVRVCKPIIPHLHTLKDNTLAKIIFYCCSNTAAATSGASVKRKNSGGLAKFLIERASKNDVIANYFYWYLVVECEVTKTAESGGGGNVTGTTGGTLGAANPGVSGGSTKMLKYHKVMHNFLDTLRSGPSEWQVSPYIHNILDTATAKSHQLSAFNDFCSFRIHYLYR